MLFTRLIWTCIHLQSNKVKSFQKWKAYTYWVWSPSLNSKYMFLYMLTSMSQHVTIITVEAIHSLSERLCHYIYILEWLSLTCTCMYFQTLQTNVKVGSQHDVRPHVVLHQPRVDACCSATDCWNRLRPYSCIPLHRLHVAGHATFSGEAIISWIPLNLNRFNGNFLCSIASLANAA